MTCVAMNKVKNAPDSVWEYLNIVYEPGPMSCFSNHLQYGVTNRNVNLLGQDEEPHHALGGDPPRSAPGGRAEVRGLDRALEQGGRILRRGLTVPLSSYPPPSSRRRGEGGGLFLDVRLNGRRAADWRMGSVSKRRDGLAAARDIPPRGRGKGFSGTVSPLVDSGDGDLPRRLLHRAHRQQRPEHGLARNARGAAQRRLLLCEAVHRRVLPQESSGSRCCSASGSRSSAW